MYSFFVDLDPYGSPSVFLDSAMQSVADGGVVVYEYELKIGWGSKSVSLPGQALPAPPPGQIVIRSKEGATVILSGPMLVLQ
ncbi:hypothetical protein IFM89_013741 [Coptis chinensis]|uniref:Uncharacterized protein n=1 Tax=Coptis chinensis TaxID=261450 RepID=A0A835HSQ6_9MAGN|nr:hypothetical protein IFM89_013741 [Coptis chinensis]